jgi:hypothetical protein
MPIPKITGDPFINIRSWVWERKKIIRPNPLKPSNTQITTEKKIDNNKLQKTLNGFLKKINKIIDEVNKLIKQVAKNKNEITKINKKLQVIDNIIKLKSTATHIHAAATPFTSGPQGRKGGSVKRMKQGGSSGQCIKHQMPDGTIMDGPPHGPNQTCIEWSNGNYQNGGKFTKPVPRRR